MSQKRVDKAAEGIESSIVSLSERLKQQPDGEAVEHDLRLLEALLFAAVEPIDVQTLRERMPESADIGALLPRLVRDLSLIHI